MPVLTDAPGSGKVMVPQATGPKAPCALSPACSAFVLLKNFRS